MIQLVQLFNLEIWESSSTLSLTSPHPNYYQVLPTIPYFYLWYQHPRLGFHPLSPGFLQQLNNGCSCVHWALCFHSFGVCACPSLNLTRTTCGLFSSILRSFLPQGLRTECLLARMSPPPAFPFPRHLLANVFTPSMSQLKCHFLPEVCSNQEPECLPPTIRLSHYNLKFYIYFISSLP